MDKSRVNNLSTTSGVQQEYPVTGVQQEYPVTTSVQRAQQEYPVTTRAQQEYPVTTCVTSSGVQQQGMVTTTQLLQQGQQAMSSVTSNSTFVDNGTTGPIAVNPILGGTDLLSPTRDYVEGSVEGSSKKRIFPDSSSAALITRDNVEVSVEGSPTMRILVDSSSAALMNVINNSCAMLNQNLVNSSKVSTQNNVPGKMSSSEYESKLLVNSLYRKGSSRRRRLIQNPWDQVESSHHLVSLESMNPRYASRPELFPGHGTALYLSRHLRGSSSNNVNNSDHVYECIDADSVNNYNILSDELRQQLSSSHQHYNRRSNN